MRLAHRFATPAVWMLLVLGPVLGCGQVDPSTIPAHHIPEHVKVLRMQLPSFDTSPPDGIRLWRLSETTGEFEPISEIRLSEPVVEDGEEFVGYTLIDPAGNPIELPLSARVERDGAFPTLALWVVRFAPAGEFKASLFNAAGESSLSQETLTL